MRCGSRVFVAVAMLCFTMAMAACAASVHRPRYRSNQYLDLVREYKTATIVPSELDAKARESVWNYELPSDSLVNASISGRRDFITVRFADEAEPRLVYALRDYTNNLEVRVKGSTLYVYRVVQLISIEYRLAVYDLAHRKLRKDLLVAPEDMLLKPKIADS
jgi:hypothetical protein